MGAGVILIENCTFDNNVSVRTVLFFWFACFDKYFVGRRWAARCCCRFLMTFSTKISLRSTTVRHRIALFSLVFSSHFSFAKGSFTHSTAMTGGALSIDVSTSIINSVFSNNSVGASLTFASAYPIQLCRCRNAACGAGGAIAVTNMPSVWVARRRRCVV